MKAPIRAMIRWVPRERDGRTAPPEGPRYTTVARFEDDRDEWPNVAWSLVVEPIRSYGRTKDAMLARVRFLSPDAPRELLAEGKRFELCEGRRVVAKGVVLPSSLEVPARLNEFALALLG